MRAFEPSWPRKDKGGDTFGKAGGEIERHTRAHRNAADDGTRNLQVIHQFAEVVGKCMKAKMLAFAKRGRPVAARVEGNQADMARWQKEAEGLSNIRAQAVLEKERRASAPALAV